MGTPCLSFIISNIDRDTAKMRTINQLRIFYNFTISFIYIFMNFYKRSFDFLSDANNDFKEYSLEYFLLNIQASNIFFSELILCYNTKFHVFK